MCSVSRLVEPGAGSGMRQRKSYCLRIGDQTFEDGICNACLDLRVRAGSTIGSSLK